MLLILSSIYNLHYEKNCSLHMQKTKAQISHVQVISPLVFWLHRKYNYSTSKICNFKPQAITPVCGRSGRKLMWTDFLMRLIYVQV